MTLTREQIDFGSAKNTTISDTAANLMNFFKPINEEGLAVKDFKSTFLGGADGYGMVGIGCAGILGFCILLCVIGAFTDMSDNSIYMWNMLFFVVIVEFCIINYIYNKHYIGQHPGAPAAPDKLSSLIMPLIGFLSQDMSDDEEITVKSALIPLESGDFELSDREIKEMGKNLKRGLRVYSGELLELTTRLADGTNASFVVNEVLSTVHVHKKHSSDKTSRKEKVTIKAGFAFPANAYSETQEGEFELDENTTAVVTASERRVKVVVKKVLSDFTNESDTEICIPEQKILDGCIDAMAAAYSVVC